MRARNINHNIIFGGSLNYDASGDAFGPLYSSTAGSAINVTPNMKYVLKSSSLNFSSVRIDQNGGTIIWNYGLLLSLSNTLSWNENFYWELGNPLGITNDISFSGADLEFALSDTVYKTSLLQQTAYRTYVPAYNVSYPGIPVLFGQSLVRIIPGFSVQRIQGASLLTTTDINFKDSLDIYFDSKDYRYLLLQPILMNSEPFIVSDTLSSQHQFKGMFSFSANLTEYSLKE